jgi:ABC-type lipoprotein export system ATPase subunit
MQTIDLVIETETSTSIRARQVSSMFDVPPSEKCRLEWHVDFPIDAESWNVGLIVGPSGSGKSVCSRHLWGDQPELTWSGKSVIDDVARPIEDVVDAFSSVGFNTIPAWLRPFSVLSNGERFRVDVARRLLELPDPIVVDEFTSVVDRQVAQIGSHAIQKYIRKHNRKFVAVTCHYDVIDWLQPDWVLDMSTRQFTRRLLQRRPDVHCELARIPRSSWSVFAPFHYMKADIHISAKCFGLWANGTLAAFVATLHMPHPRRKNIKRVTRTVCLPDWQGLGLAYHTITRLGSAHASLGEELRMYPNHPALIRSFQRSPNLWRQCKQAGVSSSRSKSASIHHTTRERMGACFGAVFAYVGPKMEDADDSRRLLL